MMVVEKNITMVSVNDDVYADDVDRSHDHDNAIEKHYLSLREAAPPPKKKK